MIVRKASAATAQSAVTREPRPRRRPPAAPVEPVARKQEKREKPGAGKVIRDSFTMPASDYAMISELKELCLASGVAAKKSEILRAGLRALKNLSPRQVKAIVTSLEPVKTGRPSEKK